MSDDEVERFEITDHDLDNEFNFGLRRARMSKNQVWSLLQFSFVCFFNPTTTLPHSGEMTVFYLFRYLYGNDLSEARSTTAFL